MEAKKFKLIQSDKEGLFRIKALRDFSDVKSGDIGGYVSGEHNLSHDGLCWVYDNAIVLSNARVCGNAFVDGYAGIYGNAIIKEKGDYIVFHNTWSSGRYFTWTRSNDKWRVGCFYGTGKELIKKAYGDSELKGRMYKKYVKLVNEMLKEEKELADSK